MDVKAIFMDLLINRKGDYNIVNKEDSQSPTEVILGHVMENSERVNVAMKIFIDITEIPKGKNKYSWLKILYDSVNNLNMILMIKGLKYEMEMYEYITKNIIEPRLSPNFMPSLGQTITHIDSDILLKDLKKRYGYLPDNYPLKTGILLTKVFSNTDSLRNLKYTFDQDDLEKIYFQIIYALAILEKFKIVHNDLHNGNIFIQTLEQPVKYAFVINKKRYLIDTQYIPIIYDWDYSYCEELSYNRRMEQWFCGTKNMCSEFEAGKDLYTLLCMGRPELLSAYNPDEYELEHNLSNKDLEILKKEPIYYYNETIPIYRLSGKIARKLFGDKIRKSTKTIMVELKNNKLSSVGASCHITAYDDRLITPLQLIHKKFSKFLNKNEEANETFFY